MSDITNLLIALAFIVIGATLLIMFIVTRVKVAKIISETLTGNATDSKANAKAIIDKMKKMVWYVGLAYVTIALALFFEGIGAVFGIQALNIVFVIAGVVFFLYGVIMTAYGVLALYNDTEKKYGKMAKARLVTICKLADDSKLLVFVPEGSFGGEVLNNIEMVTAQSLDSYKLANGRFLDFCVIDDINKYSIGKSYLVYTNALRVKYNGINISFITSDAIDSEIIANKQEQAVKEPIQQKEDVIAEPKPIAKRETKATAKKASTAKKTTTKTTKKSSEK